MRALLQRVTRAAVSADNGYRSAIGRGICCFIGIHRDDTEEDLQYIINKIRSLRLFEDANGVMNQNVSEAGGELMIISQFTLYGETRKGNRPSWSRAMAPNEARLLFDLLLERLTRDFGPVQTGVFGVRMAVDLVNDGPVTLMIDSKE